jgi:hypothetical protein
MIIYDLDLACMTYSWTWPRLDDPFMTLTSPGWLTHGLDLPCMTLAWPWPRLDDPQITSSHTWMTFSWPWPHLYDPPLMTLTSPGWPSRPSPQSRVIYCPLAGRSGIGKPQHTHIFSFLVKINKKRRETFGNQTRWWGGGCFCLPLSTHHPPKTNTGNKK